MESEAKNAKNTKKMEKGLMVTVSLFYLVVYNGYEFKKDDVLLTNMYQMHRRSPLHDKPDFFVPDRYLDTSKTMHVSANGDVDRRDHYNFGWGRRICPGIYLVKRA